jgi:hypothetical protein
MSAEFGPQISQKKQKALITLVNQQHLREQLYLLLVTGHGYRRLAASVPANHLMSVQFARRFRRKRRKL